MNPSSSSNADSERSRTFKVATRQLSRDLAAAGPEHDARELGALDAAELDAALGKLAALPFETLLDADPHLVISARRGRFLVRPGRGVVRLFDAGDPMRTPLELPRAEVSGYLANMETAAPSESAPAPVPVDVTAERTKSILSIGLLLASLLAVAISASLTFRSRPIDADVNYTAVAPGETHATLSRRFLGTFATGSGDGSRVFTLEPGGKLTLREYGPDDRVVFEQTDAFQLALRDGTVPVARTAELGPIESSHPDHLLYAGETYTRQP